MNHNKYESHITVAPIDGLTISKLETYCKNSGLRCLVIELAQGEHPYQPMTSSFHQGEEAVVKTEVFILATELAAQGFNVQRLKIEANINNLDVPLGDTPQLIEWGERKYFEAHLQVVVPSEEDLLELQDLCQQISVHVSKNAQVKSRKRFVTVRVYQAGLQTALRRMEDVVSRLRNFGFKIDKVIKEYVIFDSRLELDKGW